jgi:hypothetical protein
MASSFPVQSYVPIIIDNSTPFADDQVWIAAYGQLFLNPGDGSTPTGPTYYLDAAQIDQGNPVPQPASGLLPAGPATPDGVILPSSTLAQWGSSLAFPIPAVAAGGTQQYSGRILLSLGAPVQAQVAAGGTVSAPSAGNPADPSTGTFYDFLEFTVASNPDGSNNVDVDTSQVDSFGLPVTLQFFNANGMAYNIGFTGDTTQGSAVVQNLSLSSGLGAGQPVSGTPLPTGSLIISIPAGANPTQLTLNQNAAATAQNATLSALLAGPVGVQAQRGAIFGDPDATGFDGFIQAQIGQGNANARPFLECSGASPLRLVSPKDVTEALTSPQSTDPLNNYFNALIDAFFLQYYSGTVSNGSTASTGSGQTFSLQSGASGSLVTYQGSVQLAGGNYLLRLNAVDGSDTTDYDIYYPFFTTNLPASATYTPRFPPAAAPPSIVNQGESASQMVFACDGIFSDNTQRGLATIPAAVLGDLENSISAAFNRGIVLNDPSTWADMSQWYPANGAYNYWVQYWHQNGIAVNNLAYAFPFDDKFGTSTNLQQNSLSRVSIGLGSWGALALPMAGFDGFPSSAKQGGQITLTASVTGGGSAPTGTVTFYVDGYPLNPNGYAGGPSPHPVSLGGGKAKLTATLPPLPDGAHTHTYTVTAVYGGDENYFPAVAYQSLRLTGVDGDFPVSLNPPSFPVGTDLQVTVSLPLSAVNGTLALSLVDSAGNAVPGVSSSAAVTTAVNTLPLAIPANALCFTGDLTLGSAVVANASSTANLAPGQGLSGTGVPPGTTVSGFVPNQSVTLSQNATASGTGIAITSNAINVTYHVKASYTPTGATQPTLTGLADFAFTAS